MNETNRHPRLGGTTSRYSFGGSTPKQRAPVAPDPPPTPIDSSVEVNASKRSIQERLKRQRGIASTINSSNSGALTSTPLRSSLG